MAKYQLRLFYDVTVSTVVIPHRHNMYLRVQGTPTPGTAFDSITVEGRNATTDDLDAMTDAYLVLLRPCSGTATNFVRWELWVADDFESENYTFIGTKSIGLAGTGSTTTAAQQTIMTFRCDNGDSMQWHLMEGDFTGNAKDPYPFSSGDLSDVADYIIDAVSPFVSRKGRDIIAPINALNGQNEKLTNRRFR